MVIDPHVHGRDFNQRDRETVQHLLEVARDSGVSGVFDMPNTDPPIMTRQLVVDRLALARDAGVEGVFYGVYMGLTGDPDQVKRAVAVQREFPQVIGFKLYAGHSVGNLGVIDTTAQRTIYDTLTSEGYTGVMVVHCEKEDFMDNGVFDSEYPETHCDARPALAEIQSVSDQIAFARETGFRGKLHIAHISSPIAVRRVAAARAEGLDISCGVCPHHFIYDRSRMIEEDGLLYKMNPPLRSPGDPQEMLHLLRNGTIDWIETDHAPHTHNQKVEDCCSGLPGLPAWPLVLEFLRREDFDETLIARITHGAVAERFELDLPMNTRPVQDRRDDYAFDPYERLAVDLGWPGKD